MNKRRIQPKGAVEHETVSLRLPVPSSQPSISVRSTSAAAPTAPTSSPRRIEIALEHDKGFQKTLAAKPAAPASGPVRTTA